jgi:hypothetical protein
VHGGFHINGLEEDAQDLHTVDDDRLASWLFASRCAGRPNRSDKNANNNYLQ